MFRTRCLLFCAESSFCTERAQPVNTITAMKSDGDIPRTTRMSIMTSFGQTDSSKCFELFGSQPRCGDRPRSGGKCRTALEAEKKRDRQFQDDESVAKP